jgi:hypothetical protein
MLLDQMRRTFSVDSIRTEKAMINIDLRNCGVVNKYQIKVYIVSTFRSLQCLLYFTLNYTSKYTYIISIEYGEEEVDLKKMD